MPQQVVHHTSGLRRPPLTTQELIADSSRRHQELLCFFTRPFGHRWDNPLGHATYERDGKRRSCVDAIRICLDCGLRQKLLSSTPSHTDYRWCRLRENQV